MNLLELFEDHKGNPVHKYSHHIEAYDKIFERFKNTAVSILEIGLARGGSLELWRKYFGMEAAIFGMDIQDMTVLQKDSGARIFVGDQGKIEDLKRVLNKLPDLDIVIDDGSHQSEDQIVSFQHVFKRLKDKGVYIVEDIHTSYRETYGGGYLNQNSFVEYIKRMIDGLHYSEEGVPRPAGCSSVFGVHVYPGLAIIEKRNPTSWGGSTMRPA